MNIYWNIILNQLCWIIIEPSHVELNRFFGEHCEKVEVLRSLSFSFTFTTVWNASFSSWKLIWGISDQTCKRSYLPALLPGRFEDSSYSSYFHFSYSNDLNRLQRTDCSFMSKCVCVGVICWRLLYQQALHYAKTYSNQSQLKRWQHTSQSIN